MTCYANYDRLRGYRIKLYPTEDQKAELNQAIHTFRAIYNAALNIENDRHEKGQNRLKYFDLSAMFSELRKNNPEFKWLNNISDGSMRIALRNLDNAFEKFFKKLTRYPKFKSRKRSKKCFGVRSDRTHVHGQYISISGLKNKLINAKNHPIPEGVRMYKTSISFDGYDYWFSCCVEKEIVDMSEVPVSEPIGVDVGIRNMITTSDGEFYHFSDTQKLEKRLRKQQRRLSKDYDKYLTESLRTKTKYEDVPKSKNHFKRLEQQRKTYNKIRNKRYNDMNTATKRIVDKNPSAIVIENISVRSMLKDPWMKKYAPQMVFYELHRQITYKAADRNIPVIVADENYASSKICSRCGNKHNVSGSVFKCPYCGFRIDRDLNAALNLKSLAYENS